MTEVVVETRGLVKDYGSVRALDGLDLEVRRGEVLGLLGPNGAGKSTAIRILLDQLRPTAGTVRVLGVDPRQGGAPLRAEIGYLPGELATDSGASAGERLAYLARLRGGRGAERIGVLAERLDLDLSRPIRALSKGNKQKVGIIQAFMHRPRLLVLDEPTSGLDPLLQREVLDLVGESIAEGASVLMSSHVLSEVDVAADRIAVVRRGVIVDVDRVATLRHRAGQRVEATVEGALPADLVTGLAGVEDVEVDGSELRLVLRGEPDALLKVLATHRVTRLSMRDRDIEDLFLGYYRMEPDGDEGRADTDEGGHRSGRAWRRGR